MSASTASDDRWGFRAKRDAFLARYGDAATGDADQMRADLDEVTDALLREARYHATWPVATAEKWRYDRLQWVFAVMLGEANAEDAAPADDDYDPRTGQPYAGTGAAAFLAAQQAREQQ